MKATRAFRIIGRTNQVLLLGLFAILVVVAVGALVSDFVRDQRRDRARAEREVPSVSEVSGPLLEFRDPVSVEGTALSILGVEEVQGTTSKFGSEPYVSWTRNLLFHDAASGTSRWLRPDSRACIAEWERVRENGDSSGPVRWIRYEIAEADTDGDGRISCSDRLTVAISGPNGAELVPALRDVDRVRGYGPVRRTLLTIFFVRAGEERVADVDLAAKRVIRDQALPVP
jgi:hypothetical protein